MTTTGPTDQGVDYSIPGLRIQSRGGAWALVIQSDARQSDWVLHKTGFEASLVPDSVETTIIYRGEGYRIHEERQAAGGWVYNLNPMPPSEPWRKPVELSAFHVLSSAAEAERERRESMLVEASALYDFLIGALPARTQVRLSERMHFDPERASRRNALLEFVVCIIALPISLLIFVGGAASGSGLSFVGLLWILGLFEGAARWAHVVASDRPIGLLALELGDWVVRRIQKGRG